MEIIRERKENGQARMIYLGVLFIVLGILWLLSNLGIYPELLNMILSWQMLIAAVGGYLLASRRWFIGGVTTAIGVFLLLAEIADLYVPVKQIIMPVLLVVFGLALLFPRE